MGMRAPFKYPSKPLRTLPCEVESGFVDFCFSIKFGVGGDPFYCSVLRLVGITRNFHHIYSLLLS